MKGEIHLFKNNTTFMKRGRFNKKAFKDEVRSSMRMLYRKDIEDANQQELYQAVANVIEGDIIDQWMSSCKRFEEKDRKSVV